MPDLGITEILSIASLIAGGVGTGLSVYEQNKTRDAQAQAQKSAQQAQQQQQLLQKREALLAAGPNAQAQTGGSLTGQAGQSFVDTLAGYGSSSGGPTGGGSSPTNATPTPSNATPSAQPNFQDILAMLSRQQQQNQSPFSGGWNSPPPQQLGGRFNLAQFNLGG